MCTIISLYSLIYQYCAQLYLIENVVSIGENSSKMHDEPTWKSVGYTRYSSFGRRSEYRTSTEEP